MPRFLTTECSFCYHPSASTIRCADCGELCCDDCREDSMRMCDGCGEWICQEHRSLFCEKCKAYQKADEQAREHAKTRLERLAKKAAQSGLREDLEAYLKERRVG